MVLILGGLFALACFALQSLLFKFNEYWEKFSKTFFFVECMNKIGV